jgi:hypothetical protein
VSERASTVDRRELRAFVEDALERYGALVERGLRRSDAVLPSALATALDRDESVALTEASEELGATELVCSLGAPAIEWLLTDLRREPVLVADEPDVAAPRANQARSMAARVSFRNAVASVGESRVTSVAYVRVVSAWSAEADDRYEGLVSVTRCARDSAFAPTGYVEGLPAGPRSNSALTLTAAVSKGLCDDVSRAIRAAIAPIEASIERRKSQEVARTQEYFAALWADVAAPKRKIDAKVLLAKRAAIVAERDAKLREIPERYALRVRSRWVYARVCEVPAVLTELVVKRRKAERAISARLGANAASLDVWACESCAGPCARPALCDERLHLVCESCAPNAQGRWVCPACATGR